jgi:hypothetical protein
MIGADDSRHERTVNEQRGLAFAFGALRACGALAHDESLIVRSSVDVVRLFKEGAFFRARLRSISILSRVFAQNDRLSAA